MKKRKARLLLIGIVAGALVFTILWFRAGLRPTAPGSRLFVRYETSERLGFVLADLSGKGVLRDPRAFQVYAWLHRRPNTVAFGTYAVAPGMTADEVLDALNRPVRQMVRVPETNWSTRTAHYLAERGVLDADEYMDFVHHPSVFKGEVSFPLPAASLEGYLYPDTYDFPPLLGARPVILRQLKTFERKIWKKYKFEDLKKTLTIASLVELEAGREEDRAKIAGVIYNRLKKKMPLQIDSALLYKIGKWRDLKASDFRRIDSPYNLYQHKGLPPGPICSPGERSIRAALNPATHGYFYYVALPDGRSLFGKTYAEHLKNVAKRKAALRAVGASR